MATSSNTYHGAHYSKLELQKWFLTGPIKNKFYAHGFILGHSLSGICGSKGRTTSCKTIAKAQWPELRGSKEFYEEEMCGKDPVFSYSFC